jgi:hypothetical protein
MAIMIVHHRREDKRSLPVRWWRVPILPLALAAALAAASVRAQAPSWPVIYIFGRDVDADTAGPWHSLVPDGEPDVVLKLYLNNLAYYLKKPGAEVSIQSMVLSRPGSSGMIWDTIPYSGHPLLVVVRDGEIVNSEDGSIAGLDPGRSAYLELRIADPGGRVADHPAGMRLEIRTLDGDLTLPVTPENPTDMSRY